jgi:hypothetical protein
MTGSPADNSAGVCGAAHGPPTSPAAGTSGAPSQEAQRFSPSAAILYGPSDDLEGTVAWGPLRDSGEGSAPAPSTSGRMCNAAPARVD